MQKDKQFRKGTKSCTECRQRKLRCIPSADDSQPCQNCAAKGRNCVLQIHAGRAAHSSGVSSTRDRIRYLEDSVGKLWSAVRDLKTELGHKDVEHARDELPHHEDEMESDSDLSDSLPLDPGRPTHLQQLFDNEILDTMGSNGPSPESSTSGMTGSVMRARSKLRPLLPPKKEFMALAPTIVMWIAQYSRTFGKFSLFQTAEELEARYNEVVQPDCDPLALAGVLLALIVAIQNSDADLLDGGSEILNHGPYVRRVSDVVEEVIVNNDAIASTISGVEISLLWIRPQLVRGNDKKLWLSLRRCIALAELIGLPRAKQGNAADAWESICIVDRFFCLLFNLPLGTAAHGMPPAQEVVLSNGQVNVKVYINNMARIATAVQETDGTYVSLDSDRELFDKVYRIDEDLRSLRAKTPETWWTEKDPGTVDLLMQIFHNYLTIRAHLQLALRNSTAPECTYSFLTCIKASQDLAERYVELRTNRSPTFFVGRMIDLEAMTCAFVLIYSSCTGRATQAAGLQDGRNEAPREAAYKIVQVMESLVSQDKGYGGCDVARKASKAIRSLDMLLNQPTSVDSNALSLHIPTLGKLNVSRHPDINQGLEQTMQPQTLQQAPYPQSHQSFPLVNSDFDPSGADALTWSLDTLMGDFTTTGDLFSHEQWYQFSNV